MNFKNYLIIILFFSSCSQKTSEHYYNKALNEYNLVDAVGFLNKAIELDSTQEKYFCERGRIKATFGDVDRKYYKEAMADFEKAILLNPKYAEAYFKRGIAKFNMKYKMEACEDWKNADQLGYADAGAKFEKECK